MPTFHLIEDDSLEHDVWVRVAKIWMFKPPPLLSEIHLTQVGEEGGVEVNWHQVFVVLPRVKIYISKYKVAEYQKYESWMRLGNVRNVS